MTAWDDEPGDMISDLEKMRDAVLGKVKFRGLDMFCGGGGCTRGYLDGFRNRGYELSMEGMDWRKQPRYFKSGGDQFWHSSVMHVLGNPLWYGWLDTFDFFHLSPPCQAHSPTSTFNPNADRHEDLVTPCLKILKEQWSHKLWVMENVPQAPMYSRIDQILRLCGSSFPGLSGFDERRLLHRHRWLRLHGFKVPKKLCQHNGYKGLGVYGSLNSAPPTGGETCQTLAEGKKLMGIDWMLWDELKEAIPPPYTQYVSEATGGLVDTLVAKYL